MTTVKTDLAIIGAGPAGLYAAFEAGRHGMSAHIVDVLERPGGQCAELYPDKPIYDIPGLVSSTGSELTQSLLAQIDRFKPTFHLGAQAVGLIPGAEARRWSLQLSTGTTINAGAVVVAAGAGSFEPRRMAVADAEAYEGTSLLYAVREVESFRGRRVVIVGGGDSAVDWALALHGVASHITVVHRREAFRAVPSSIDELKSLISEGKIELKVGRVAAIQGTSPLISAVDYESPSGFRETIACDAVLVFFGLTNRLGPIMDWGIATTMDRLRVNPVTMETSLPGVFAIGDVADYAGKLKLILCGFHEAALMGQAAFQRLHGSAPRFEYSTHSKSMSATDGSTVLADIPNAPTAEPSDKPLSPQDYILVTDRNGQSYTVLARPGMSLLELITEAKIEIKGSCYGACNCSTCHVYIDDAWLPEIPNMLDQEQEALDQVSVPMHNSRLACQIGYHPRLAGMRVQLSEDTRLD